MRKKLAGVATSVSQILDYQSNFDSDNKLMIKLWQFDLWKGEKYDIDIGWLVGYLQSKGTPKQAHKAR